MQNIPIYIISLKRTPERRLSVQRQLDAYNLKYQVIEAVDAYNFQEAELKMLDIENPYQADNTNPLSALGCLLSHIKFYDQVIQNNHKIACVLEDDAQLLPSFPDILNSEKLQQKKWEILLLAHQSETVTYLLESYYKYITIKQKRFRLYDKYILGALPGNFSQKICKGHYISKNSEHMKSTLNYLIRPPAAKKLKEIALAYKDYVYIDDLVGDQKVSGIDTRLITPPCTRPNITYLRHSLINPLVFIPNTSSLPDEKLLIFFMRNKWTTIIMQLAKLQRIKMMVRFAITLIRFERERMKKYFMPNKYCNKRVMLAKKQHATSK